MQGNKTEVPGILKVRDGILINTDNKALQAYKNRKRKEKLVYEMQDDIQSLKSDLEEIKNLLRGLSK
jgi:hypothetical protein